MISHNREELKAHMNTLDSIVSNGKENMYNTQVGKPSSHHSS